MTLEDEVRYWIDLGGSSGEIANALLGCASRYDPAHFMHLVPAEVQRELEQISIAPPASISDFVLIQSSNYRTSFFEGLSKEQIEAKIEEDNRQMKQRRLDALVALNKYFAMQRSISPTT